jgi:hypothetical protein
MLSYIRKREGIKKTKKEVILFGQWVGFRGVKGGLELEK